MNERSQFHIFWGAPIGPLKMTVSQERDSLTSAADPWKKFCLLYNQHSSHMKGGKCKHRNLDDYQIPETVGPEDLLSHHFPTNSNNRSVHVKDDFINCPSETQSIKCQEIHPSEMNDTTNSDVQMCEFKCRVQHSVEEEKCQTLISRNEKITHEQHKNTSNTCDKNLQNNSLLLDHKCAVALDLGYDTEQTNTRSRAGETKCVPAEHHEIQKFFSSNTVAKSKSAGTVRKISDLKISTDTEFLSIMTSSQVAFLAQREYTCQDSINKDTMNLETEPKKSHGEVRITKDHFQPSDNFTGGCEDGQNEAHSLELFSPIYPETEDNHIHINSEKGLEKNISSEEQLPPNETYIKLCNSGLLCSQLNTFHQSSVKRSHTSEGQSGHSKILHVSKKIKLVSNAREVNQKKVSKFKGITKTSLIKDCDSKSQKYNCLVMVLSPCHVKEVSIKSGPNAGSKVPLATIVVTDQSKIQKKVVLWRTAAFWALTVFLGDILLLTDVTVHEDHWVGETKLQSTFTSQLLNLGSCSSVQPEEYSNIVSDVVLQDLLDYVSVKHFYLQKLPQRQFQKMNSIEFVELEKLQPDTLVNAVLRVVDISILTEAIYNYRGQKQRKIMLTVEQVQGQHYVLVLWGFGAAWFPQLQRKKDYIWEFKYLYVQRNCILETLELHTTHWSSCECLFDDDKRSIAFKAKFHKSTTSLVKMSDLATHLEDRCSGVILFQVQILELVFPGPEASNIVLNAHSSLKSIYSSLPNIIYTGCAKCALELEVDENKIYKQCFSCLPLDAKKIYYRPALMTIVDGRDKICIHVGSKLIEKILLNIPPDWLNRVIEIDKIILECLWKHNDLSTGVTLWIQLKTIQGLREAIRSEAKEVQAECNIHYFLLLKLFCCLRRGMLQMYSLVPAVK
ncbi:shieldin complex subunit 2 isoform X2 [Erinaceus europaeus]|nr:shieldin complex subunit 2 isoform X2 [Erinaceus europaeus]